MCSGNMKNLTRTTNTCGAVAEVLASRLYDSQTVVTLLSQLRKLRPRNVRKLA